MIRFEGSIHSIIIVLYHQTNTLLNFLYQYDSNCNPLFNNKRIYLFVSKKKKKNRLYLLIYKIFHTIQLGDL